MDRNNVSSKTSNPQVGSRLSGNFGRESFRGFAPIPNPIQFSSSSVYYSGASSSSASSSNATFSEASSSSACSLVRKSNLKGSLSMKKGPKPRKSVRFEDDFYPKFRNVAEKNPPQPSTSGNSKKNRFSAKNFHKKGNINTTDVPTQVVREALKEVSFKHNNNNNNIFSFSRSYKYDIEHFNCL